MAGTVPRTVAALVRALVSLALLLLLLVVLPVALLYGTLALAGPGGLPLPSSLPALLTDPDQGQLFVWVLAAVGWLAWGMFALGVCIELTARLRGRAARRLPVLGWSQRAAALLLGAVFALVPAAGAFAAPSVSPPPGVTASATANGAAVQAAAAQAHYTVRAARPAETLWTIAQTQLGSGARWNDIAALNQGRVMDAHGTVFYADGALAPGWKLLMPAAVPAEAATGSTVTVHRGDSLTGIATAHHVPGGWQSVYAANRAVVGRDPDVIQPGEKLRLPGTTAAHNPAPHPVPRPAVTVPGEPALRPTLPDSLIPVPAPAMVTAPRTATAPRAGSANPLQLPVSIGAGALLAAGLVGLLARNRVLQQRRRPPRRRVAMPGIEEQLYETFLRAMADPAGLDLLDRTLRTLGMTCLDTDTELPALAAVALRPGGSVDLHLIDPAPAVAPFTGSADGLLWRCHAPDADLLSAERARDVPAPYPALVTLGRTVDGVQILADLETVRHLHLDGTPGEVAAVSRALVAELAASPLAGRMRLIALGGAAPLVGRLIHGTDAERLATRADPELALADLQAHRHSLEKALIECQVMHPRAARSQGVAVDLWAPSLLCTDQQLTPSQFQSLSGVLAGPEHHCVAAVTPAVPGAPGWHLDAGPGHHPVSGSLPFAVELQRLSEQEFAATIALLSAAQQPSDLPEPAWTDHHPDEEEPEPDPDGDPFLIPVLASHSRATGGAAPASATSVPLLAPDLPGGGGGVGGIAAFGARGSNTAGGGRDSLLPVLSSGRRAAEAAAASSDADRASAPDRADDPGPAPATAPGGPRAAFPPRILMLGPVRVIGAAGATPAGPASISQLTAVAALLITHPEPDPRLLDAVLDPVPYAADRLMAARSAPQARFAAMSRLREWLGAGPDGVPWLPESAWRLHHAVSCDWADFQELYRLGMNARGPAEDAALRRALDLVRGGPFAGAHQLYPWAEPFRQDMISAVIDASHELAKRCFAAGDLPGCEAALHRGLAAVPEAEILHRGLIRLYATAGYRDHVAASITRLAQVNDALGCLDYEPETLQLFSMISSHRS
ncbi:LysM peptidoglycan-binding domain-containing protein [Streptacidiphilus sp. PAMC 29251]